MTVLAWHGEPSLKAAALERLREHRRLEELIQGQYWEEGHGCQLGCLTHHDVDQQPHAAAERLFGIPLRLGHWLESVFEGLDDNKCADWVIASTEALPVGADLSRCHHQLAVWLLGPRSPSAEGNTHPLVHAEIARIRDLHRRAADGETISGDEWSAAESAAWSAERSAAERSAAESAAESAWSAARSAERSAAESAWSAARSAERSAAWSAARSAERSAAESARSAAWDAIAAKSLEIFRAAPIAQAAPIADDVSRELCGLGLWCPEGVVV